MSDKKEKKPSISKLALVPAPLSEAGTMRFGCQECGLSAKDRTPFSMPFVPKNWTKKLLLVGIDPSYPADKAMVTKWARRAGYCYEDVAYVNPLRCDASEPSMKQLRACRPFLLRVLDRLQPEAALVFGKDALRAVTNDGTLTNIMHTRGTHLEVPGITSSAKIFCTYHPSSIQMGGTHYASLVLEDFKRSNWPELPWPEEYAPQTERVGLDTEYTKGRVLTVATANSRYARTWDLEAPSILKNVQTLVGQNIFVDIDSMLKIHQPVREEWLRGIDVRDSLLLARMVDENRGKGGYDLETLLRSSFNVRPWKHKTDDISETDCTLWPVDLRNERCRLDAWASVALVDHLEPLARGPVEFTHQIAAVLHRIHHAGVMLDRPKFEEVASELYADRARAKDLLTKSAFELGMSEFEPTNDDHLRELLYNRVGLQVVERTAKENAPSVGKTTLTFHKEHPIIELLTQFNQADKLCGLIDGEKGIRPNITQPIAEDDALLHLPVNINPLAARTARRSSSQPNMQNWKPKMRRLVCSRWNGGQILDSDFRSLEPFILGWIAKDEKYFQYYKQGKGYIGIAKEVFGKDVEKGTREYRVIKEVVLGTNYGAGGKKIGKKLWIELGVKMSSDYEEHIKVVTALKKKYLDAFPGIKRYMHRQKNELLTTGQIVTLTDRVRHMPVPQGEDTPGFGHFLNAAYNYPIQSLASDVTGSALIDCEAEICREYGISVTELHTALLKREWPEVPLIINEIHDELVFDIPPMIDQKRAVELITETMRAVPTLRRVCPAFTLEIDAEHLVAPTWGVKE